MTREEAIKQLKDNRELCINSETEPFAIAYDMAINALEQEPKTGRWIPVSERLPEITKYVSEGDYKVGWYESEKCLIWFANDYAVATFNKNELTDEEDDSDGFYIVDRHYWYGLDSVDGGTYPYNDVVAWMPLPELYKAESEEKNEKI